MLADQGCGHMDMNAGYLEEFRAQCPQAESVYDLFHDPKAHTVVIEERVRVREARKASRKAAKRRAGLPGEGPPGEKGA